MQIKKIIKKKRAETTFKTIMFVFVRLFMLSFLFIAFVVVVNKYIFFDIDTIELEANNLIYLTFLNLDGPSYFDNSINRNYPFTINASFFIINNENILDELFDLGNDNNLKMATMKISLLNKNKKRYQFNNEQLSNSIYLNKNLFDTYLPIANMNFMQSKRNKNEDFGPGSIFKKNKIYYVNIYEDGNINQGFINITVLIPRS
ncbi:MAG: hypothetical protein ACOC3X_01240 [Nanoarchaeota archaeon]